MALDFFDASINRISAWTVGIRSWEKALLNALCTPNADLRKLQDENKLSELMMAQEEMKPPCLSVMYGCSSVKNVVFQLTNHGLLRLLNMRMKYYLRDKVCLKNKQK